MALSIFMSISDQRIRFCEAMKSLLPSLRSRGKTPAGGHPKGCKIRSKQDSDLPNQLCPQTCQAVVPLPNNDSETRREA